MPLLQISPTTTTTTTKSLNSPPIPFYHPHYASYFHSNSNSNSNPKFKFRPIFSLNLACKGLGVAVSSSSPPDSKLRNKHVDVATLGNLCVDIVLNVPQLPPPSLSQRKAFMERLASSPPSKKFWEAGGTCNMSIAAARLGLDCVSIGHVGNEIYGKFLLDVLHDEGVDMVKISTNDDIVSNSGASDETLICWVLVDPLQRHGFCSRADFFKEPAFNWLSKMSREAKLAIKNSKVLFCNGYGFDEFSPGLLLTVVDCAVEVGTSIFFDPGPRGKNLITGTPEEQRALSHFLRMSDVLLLTADEAESLTGIGDPILAGQELLKRGIRTKWVIVKMGLVGSVLMTTSSITCAPAFKVNIADTVGCGDSFVAAIAYGFIHNLPMVNTLAIANAVGAATAMGCGAGRNVASIEKVVDILRSSNLNEDDEFWTQILDKKMVDQEVTCLSKIVRNVNRNHLNFVPFDKVASELLPKLEFPQTVENVRT